MKTIIKMFALSVACVSMFFLYFIHPVSYFLVCMALMSVGVYKVIKILWPEELKVNFNFKKRFSALFSRLQPLFRSDVLIPTHEI